MINFRKLNSDNAGRANGAEYLGKFLGKLSELHHGVSGEVYAVDGRTLHIKDFTYDGQGPGAYFYASTYKAADSRGFRLRDENNNGEVIRRYRKEGITLTLPEGKTLNNIKIFYVWCEDFDVSFGDVKIPRNFDFPRPQKIDALKGVHSISSDNVVIVDAQTLLIPNLYYDGEAPDAKFWVGQGAKPSPQGIRVPDENGKELPLRRYDGKTVVLTLPGDLTVFDIGHFGIWCEEFTVDFGHIPVPQALNIPPSLKMLGVSPQKHPLVYADNSRNIPSQKPLIGGHIEATTFRPHTSFSHQHHHQPPPPQQQQQQHQQARQLNFATPNYLQQGGYVPFTQLTQAPVYQQQAQERSLQPSPPQFVHQARQLYPIQQQIQESIPYQEQQQQQYFAQYQQQPLAYQNQQHQDVIGYQQQFAKPRNRFDLTPASNVQQQSYTQFG
ncbi:hypothetical protein GWI33_012719 [Rhynchophorus ferrugineus]|uniref:DM13 domain-containing protein n=1 Tax=Rhynchophorus ferrugineus TaxID=354439 RepID=A0A834MDW6_RHYFE|nr:hypothetical protein GWI33_012719 [Rhynchophorus ferrugineus]